MCRSTHTQQLRLQKLFCCMPVLVCGTPCHHICGRTCHFKHALKGHMFRLYSRPRRTATNLLSCALEDYLLTYLQYVYLCTVFACCSRCLIVTGSTSARRSISVPHRVMTVSANTETSMCASQSDHPRAASLTRHHSCPTHRPRTRPPRGRYNVHHFASVIFERRRQGTVGATVGKIRGA